MSDDEEKDVDIESDDEDEEDEYYDGETSAGAGNQFFTKAEKRAHHNALERKRRDHIKDSFHGLRDAIPTLQGEKVSRAQVLKQASEYIQFMSKKNGAIQQDIEDIKRQNSALESQIGMLERGGGSSGTSGQVRAVASSSLGGGASAADHNYGEVSSEGSESEAAAVEQRRKKLKVTK